ncbi:MAG TPA: type II secretion system F family protein [Candidatus Binataceae bacterium]|jgi:tight adherence protein C|nr:type II secretion system F family protein [Candidatus Binataceae bacterium]
MLTIWIVLVLLIVGETAVLFAFESAPRTLEQRFSDLGIKVRVGRKAFGDERDQGTARMLLHWAARRLPAPKSDSPKGEKLNQMLLQAGFTGSNALRIYGAVRVGSAVVGAVLALAVSLIANGHLTSVCTAGGAVAGFLIPSYYLAAHARRRQRAIARDLSDTLDLLVVSVEAGLALQEAIKMVGAEAERYGRPIGSELGLVTSEMLAGASLGQALRAWAKRTAVEDIKPLAATLIQSEQLGAQIAPALRASSDALRAKRRLQAEEMAQKAGVKILFPLVLFVLPAMFLVILGPPLIQSLRTLTDVAH